MRSTNSVFTPLSKTNVACAHSNLFFAADFLLHLYAAESRYNFLIDSYVLGGIFFVPKTFVLHVHPVRE